MFDDLLSGSYVVDPFFKTKQTKIRKSNFEQRGVNYSTDQAELNTSAQSDHIKPGRGVSSSNVLPNH